MSPNPPEELPGLEEIERALAESREREAALLRQREQLLLQDPHQRAERRRSRDSLIGRWRSSLGLSEADVTELKQFDPALEWLLGRGVLLADGWTEDSTHEGWQPPMSDFGSRTG